MISDVSLRAHVEAIFAEQQRAMEIAERERSKAAEALEIERSKTAEALSTALARQVASGDANLRDHIEQQVSQLRQLVASVQRETELRAAEQEKAILKSETADDKRFEAINALRGQMGDLISSHQESINKLTSSLMPREVAESKLTEVSQRLEQGKDDRAKALPREVFDRTLGELGEWRSRVDTKLATAVVADDIRRGQKEKQETKLTGWQLAVAAGGVTFFNTAIVVVANFLAA